MWINILHKMETTQPYSGLRFKEIISDSPVSRIQKMKRKQYEIEED